MHPITKPMLSALQTFKTPTGCKLRSLQRNGAFYFAGKDAARALGYAKPTDAVRKHVDKEDRTVSETETVTGKKAIVFINESGLYSLILSSKLPEAKAFKRWVTAEVLPALRP